MVRCTVPVCHGCHHTGRETLTCCNTQKKPNLIIHMLNVDPQWVQPLPMDVPTTVPNTGGVQVIVIEANHCKLFRSAGFDARLTRMLQVQGHPPSYPRACKLWTLVTARSPSPFTGSSRAFRYLHRGDFRVSPRHVWRTPVVVLG